MLKGIPHILSPDLLKVMMEMGHGDEIVIADGNFPAASHAQRLVRCDGQHALLLLDAVLQFFPLDAFVRHPVALMSVVPGDNYHPEIWPEYRKVIQQYHPHFTEFEGVERQKFYERARRAYAIVATSEMARYANLILKKGILT